MSKIPPELAKRYEIAELIGEGGMGSVYRARHRELGIDVAVKLLKSLEKDAVARFRREAQILASLEHPNLVKVFDAGLDGDVPFLVTELVDAETLADRQLRARLVPQDAVWVVAQVAAALESAHARGYVHRDVKPANIFVGADLAAKLGDFGLARTVAAGQTVTNAGMVLGTPEYMAPEQVNGFATSPTVDQYALGVVLYELLAGQLPFDGATPLATMLARVEQEPLSLAVRAPELPPLIVRVVMRMLAREPAARFASLEEVRVELELYRKGSGATLSPGLSTARLRVPFVRISGRRDTIVAPPATAGPLTGVFPGAALAPKAHVTAALAGVTLVFIGLALALNHSRAPGPGVASVRATVVAPKPVTRQVQPWSAFGSWSAVEPFVAALRADRTRADAAVHQLQKSLTPFSVGKEPGAWLYWRELGRWSAEPREPPPSPPKLQEDEDFLVLGHLTNLQDMDGAPTNLASATVEQLYHNPQLGQMWLCLGVVLENEGLVEAARKCYARGLERARPHLVMSWPNAGCQGLARALSVPPHDIEREWPSYIRFESVSQNAWRGLRDALGQTNRAVCERMMIRGGASNDVSTHPEHAREELGQFYMDIEHDEPKARAVWEDALRKRDTDRDSAVALLEYHRARGDLAGVDELMTHVPPQEEMRRLVHALREPQIPEAEAIDRKQISPRLARIVLHRRLETGQGRELIRGLTAQRELLHPASDIDGPLWIASLDLGSAVDLAPPALRTRLTTPPASWPLWSAAAGTLTTGASAAWLDAALIETRAWTDDGDAHVVRALVASRRRRWTESIDELDAALRAERTTTPGAIMAELVARPLWSHIRGENIAKSLLERFAAVKLPPAAQRPPAYQRALDQYLLELRAGRRAGVLSAARTLFEHEPREPIWGQSIAWALSGLGRRVELEAWIAQFTLACRSNGAGWWAMREITSK